jgi:parallel beta-helix repeat protein
MKRLVSGIVLMLLLMAMFSLAFNVKPTKAEWTGTVYIRADGSIDPPDAPIITYDNITYVLTNDIISPADGIVVQRDNIIIDGANHIIQGPGVEGYFGGFILAKRLNVTILNAKITQFYYGIFLYESSFCHISKNKITASHAGILLWYFSNNNNLSLNNVLNNNAGIFFTFYCKNNTVLANNIVANYEVGLQCLLSSENKIYHNNFKDNTQQAYVLPGSINTWDNGYPSGGNYWSDYAGVDLYSGPYQNETGSDGIGDTPYIIDANNIDCYPLMYPLGPWGDWNHYHNYTEIMNTLIFLNYSFPNIVDVFSIGKSWQGRDIYCIRLTNETNTRPKPKLLFVGYHHARELISAELPLYFAVEAATKFGVNETITYMLNYSEIYIIPALNVDGFEAVSQNEWQRKNLHSFDEDNDGLLDEDPPDDEDGDGYIEDLFYWDGTNYYFIRWEGIDDDNDGLLNEDWVGGVDLNRNYGYQWDAQCQSGSPNPWDEDYRGPAPFSEPETQAIRDLALNHNFKYAISFHSGAECVVYPWGYTTEDPTDKEKFEEIASEIAQLTGVWYSQSGDWYTTSGVWDDWMYGNRSTFAFTCEIYTNQSAWQYEPGPEPNTWWEKGVFQFFNPPTSQIETVIQRWLPVFTYITNKAITEFKYHDIAVTNVTPLKTIVGQGYTMNINVTVANQGDYTETFNITLHANPTVIETKQIALANGASTTITFTWNTNGFVKGNYTIWAYAWPVPGETDTDDNTFVDGWVVVAMPGDINADGIVDIFDCVRIALAFSATPHDPNWDPNADITNDNLIDIFDLVIIALHFAETDP